MWTEKEEGSMDGKADLSSLLPRRTEAHNVTVKTSGVLF